MTRLRSARGSALFIVVVVLGILAVLAMAAISITGRERTAAHLTTRSEEVRACAEVARANVLARLRSVGMRPVDISFSEPLPDSEDSSERSVFGTGHATPIPSSDGGTVSVDAVELVVRGAGAAGRQARDVTNLIGPAVLGGQYYRVAVNCTSRGRRHELEMLVRFGI